RTRTSRSPASLTCKTRALPSFPKQSSPAIRTFSSRSFITRTLPSRAYAIPSLGPKRRRRFLARDKSQRR
ncbi:hypothetical protein BC830DRAFT_1228661, partial [Chytriomyces sp. MP71]